MKYLQKYVTRQNKQSFDGRLEKCAIDKKNFDETDCTCLTIETVPSRSEKPGKSDSSPKDAYEPFKSLFLGSRLNVIGFLESKTFNPLSAEN